MGRPPSDVTDYLAWQERLEGYHGSGESIEDFCRREGVSRSTFYRWLDRLKDGIPESIAADQEASSQSSQAAFVPITLKASPVEVELPNGGIVRLPLAVGQAVLVDVIRAVGALNPRKGRKP